MSTESRNLIIDVNHLNKTFDNKVAVHDVSLQVRHGEIFGFLGPNGSGKTTTIRMLCGLLSPDSGSGTCLGYDILTQADYIRERIGYIPQNFSLYKELTVHENLIFIAELYGVVSKNSKIMSTMDYFNLTKRRNQIAGTLSGGWKQRLSLAAVLLHDPLLLLLDEPTASVDPKSRRDFWEIMHALSSEGMTILLSSHNMDEVERCHRVAYISEGRLMMSGNIKSFINNISLTTWSVKGDNLPLLAKQLEAMPSVEQVVTFYDELRVSSQDEDKIEKDLQIYMNNPRFQWQRTKTSLDDVFIWLAKRSQDENED